MNSCLYRCRVMHHRMEPKPHRFFYNIFMFYLDLDELDTLSDKLTLFGHNAFAVFNFKDTDHLFYSGTSRREHITTYLRQNGITSPVGRIMLLTHVRMLGYVFNPVSFYFIFDNDDQPICAIPEVGNTFGEMKPYLIRRSMESSHTFYLKTTKFFYVSPFIDMDAEFEFDLTLPDDQLMMRINDIQNNRRFFVSTLSGKRQILTDARLALYLLRFPLVTLQVIFFIHWQAFRLWLKKLHYHKKTDFPDLQREVHHAGSYVNAIATERR
ncbi:DUF1365 domain-containing protein [bacterium]|nr:DUF1365 domain-containing protein [bacterium]NUN44169.1 DUF1365 domain-containing protein [bacterium]